MKKITIVRAGKGGGMLSAEVGDYDPWIKLLKDEMFEKENIAVVKDVSEIKEGADAVFFLSISMLDSARGIKADIPGLKVFMITGSWAGDRSAYKEDDDGIIRVPKSNFKADKIQDIVFS